jgi:hypothetical protein
MEDKFATSIILRYPITRTAGTVYVMETYKVGKESPVPGYYEREKVLEIRISESWMPHVEVILENYGSIWRTAYVAEIHFENGDYREIVNKRKADKKDKDTAGKQ